MTHIRQITVTHRDGTITMEGMTLSLLCQLREAGQITDPQLREYITLLQQDNETLDMTPLIGMLARRHGVTLPGQVAG